MPQKIISVIVPVYNVQEYLEKCINSILEQTYADLEVILVDDGSTDGSRETCDKLAQNDRRIKVIHQQNAGQSSARNVGLDIATGDYVSFIDSDDWIDNDMYEVLMNLMNRYNPDIVSCGLKNIYKDHVNSIQTDKVVVFSNEEALEDLFSQHYIRFEVWNKIYKKELLTSLRFKSGQIHEEIYFSSHALLQANKIVYIDRPMYNYLVDRYGNTNTCFKENKLEIFKEFDNMINLLKMNNMNQCAQRAEVLCLLYVLTFYYQASRHKKISASIKRKLIDVFDEYYIKTKNNPYLSDFKNKILLFKISPKFYIIFVRFYNYLK